MAKSFFRNAKISGISACIPKKEIRLEDELQYFEGSLKKAQRMTKMVGIDRRRIAEEGVTAADICQQAAENLIAGMSIDKASIDVLIFISQGPDHVLPATACILQHKLGLSKTCATFDVNQGCTGFTYGMWLASSLVESRAASRVLILVGEASARHSNPANRVIAPVFGDAGTATLVEYAEAEVPSWYMLGTDGSGAEALVVPGGMARLPVMPDMEKAAPFLEEVCDPQGNPWSMLKTYMDGGAVFDFTLSVVPVHLRELLAYAAVNPDQIDTLVLHQANKQIMQAVAEKAGFPLEKAPHETFTKYGNQAGASIPCAICDVLAETVRNGATRLLLSGYGVGLSWSSCIVTLDHIWCSGTREYEMPAGHPMPQEIFAYWKNKLAG